MTVYFPFQFYHFSFCLKSHKSSVSGEFLGDFPWLAVFLFVILRSHFLINWWFYFSFKTQGSLPTKIPESSNTNIIFPFPFNFIKKLFALVLRLMSCTVPPIKSASKNLWQCTGEWMLKPLHWFSIIWRSQAGTESIKVFVMGKWLYHWRATTSAFFCLIRVRHDS